MESISIVLVSYGRNPCGITQIHLKSILLKTSGLVKEVVVVHNREDSNYEKEEVLVNKNRTIKVKHIGRKAEDGFFIRGIATHEGLKYATGDYIWISDPDIIYFKPNFDRFYLNLYKKFDLQFLGVCHHLEAPYEKFPCVINIFVKKSNLPDESWMKDEEFEELDNWLSKAKGKVDFNSNMYLVQLKIKNRTKEFPCQTAKIWDVGMNLWLWNKDKNGRWLSFDCEQEHLSHYYTDVVKSNFSSKFDFGKKYLLYHLHLSSHGTRPYHENLNIMNHYFEDSLRMNEDAMLMLKSFL